VRRRKLLLSLVTVAFVLTSGGVFAADLEKEVGEVIKGITEGVRYESVTTLNEKEPVVLKNLVYSKDIRTFRIETSSERLGRIISVTTPEGAWLFDPSSKMLLDMRKGAESVPGEHSSAPDSSLVKGSSFSERMEEGARVIAALASDKSKTDFYIDPKKKILVKTKSYSSDGALKSTTDYLDVKKTVLQESLFQKPDGAQAFKELSLPQNATAEDMEKLERDSGIQIEEEPVLDDSENYEEVLQTIEPAVNAAKKARAEELAASESAESSDGE
jgi:hypothetical protein